MKTKTPVLSHTSFEDDFEDSLDFFGGVARQANEVLKMAKIHDLVGEFAARILDQRGVLMVSLKYATRHVWYIVFIKKCRKRIKWKNEKVGAD
jgi:hypothetical protein